MAEETVKNYFDSGAGGMGAGAGLGAGLLGGVLGGALLNNGGLLGRNAGVVGEGCATPTQLQTAVNTVIDANQADQVLAVLGDIKGSIPAAAQGTQLFVANSVSDLRAHLGQVENTIGTMAQNNLVAINAVNTNVLQSAAATQALVQATATQNLMATKDAQAATAAAISVSTNAILAAIKDGEITNLNRELTVAQNALAEQRAEGRARGTEVNVTQTVNQNQMQLQAQAQAQQQAVLLGNIWERLNGMQQAIATNSNMIIGNTGAVGTGPQTANPVNVRT